MLQPNRRKVRARSRKAATKVWRLGYQRSASENGVWATGRGRLTARQIGAARRAMTVTSSAAVVSGSVFPGQADFRETG